MSQGSSSNHRFDQTGATNGGHEWKPWAARNKNEPQHTNCHLIYVESSVATEEQIRACISKAIKEYQHKHDKNFKTSFRVNAVSNRAGKLFGYSYIWFTNPETYHLLLGRNPDGSPRVEYYDDPNWSPPPRPYEETLREALYQDVDPAGSTGPPMLKRKSLSWADSVEEEERIQALYTCPQLTRKLDHLMPLSPIEYEKDQRDQARQLMIEEAKRKNRWTEDLVIVVPNMIQLIPGPAVVSSVESKYCHNVLCCLDIPTWITEKDLKNIFVPYVSTGSKKEHRELRVRKVNGETREEEYPWITLNKARHMAFVTFDPLTHDAQFALLMNRKVDVTRSDRSGSRQKCTLIFNHAFKTN